MNIRALTAKRIVAALLVASLELLSPTALAHDVTLDTEAAHSVLTAVANPNLSPADAHRVAQIPANQEMIRKALTINPEGTQARFEAELLAAAHGQAVQGSELFAFSYIHNNLAAVTATLDAFERNRAQNIEWVRERVQQFSPPGPSLHLRGYLIAGGCCTGFAWGGSDFYLRISDFTDAPDAIKVMLAHELYHSTQGAAMTALGHAPAEFDNTFAQTLSGPTRNHYVVGAFLNKLLNEGAATLVGDPALLTGQSRYERRQADLMRSALGLPRKLPTLLDMSLMALTSNTPLAYDDVYALGFYGPDEPLYYLGYQMAKGIVAHEGPQRLGQLAVADGCAFAMDYIALTRADPSLTKLGERSESIIAGSCQR